MEATWVKRLLIELNQRLVKVLVREINHSMQAQILY